MAKILKVTLTRGNEPIGDKKKDRHPWPTNYCQWQYTGKHTDKQGKQVTPFGGNIRYDKDDDNYYTLQEEDSSGYGCLSAAEHCVTDNPLCLTDKN